MQLQLENNLIHQKGCILFGNYFTRIQNAQKENLRNQIIFDNINAINHLILLPLLHLQFTSMSHRLDNIKTHLYDTKPNKIIQYRNSYPLDRTRVRDYIYGSKYREIVDRGYEVIASNKHIFKHGDIEDFSREEERLQSAKMALTYHKLRPFNALDVQKDPHALAITAHITYNYDPGVSVRTDITLFLYTKTLLNFHNPSNKIHKTFIERGLSSQDIGCFGLTQIGHGSDTKNLQTEALYDHSTKSFVLNTPKDTGLKFWIGGSAEMANIAVIWAQLIIKGQRHGVHPFVVPLRDRKTHTVYEGIIIGDCGSKMGLHLIDNGFIGFKHYRIPVDNLLDRISGVDQNGQFRTIQQNADKRHGLYMGAISLGRAFITINGVAAASNALLIGIKYSCVRRQFQAANKLQEQLLIDYPLVKLRLMPNLATAYIYYIVGSNILRAYGQNSKEINNPKSKITNYLHAVSAVGKAKVSWFATQAIGNIRHLLAGHGYSGYSRLGRLYVDQEINTTWEGDNHMLLQQTVKYALGTVQRLKAQPDESNILNFINHDTVLPLEFTKDNLVSLDLLQKIIYKRFSAAYDETTNYMMELKSNSLQNADIWNTIQPYHGKKIALLFGDIYYINIALQRIRQMDGTIKQITEQSFRLWIYTQLERQKWGSFETRSLLQQLIREICDWLTPRSISLVEAIAAPEQIIDSPFADWNGDRMWQKYLGLIYSGKKTFERVPYYQDIIDGRK